MRTWHRNLKKLHPPKNQKLVKSKASFSRDELADLLETLAARIRAGEMTLGTGESTVTMTMPTSFNTTMEVVDSRKRAGIERELELEIDWMVDEAGEPVEKPGPASGFAIS
ncbi:amphi-Trp domain-containing protein [Corynebacterium amycolatum]|nr:amphi-Trp domain-containing protein [Corynebacterium amycolatum]